MRVPRHFIRVGNRRVHYRLAGSGPSLLRAHQSPRSCADYGPRDALVGAAPTITECKAPGANERPDLWSPKGF